MRAGLRSYTDVCDAVFAVEIGLRFLGKTSGVPQAPLLSYLTESLKMGPQISSSVAKVEYLLTPAMSPPNAQRCSNLCLYLVSIFVRVDYACALLMTLIPKAQIYYYM